MHFGGRDVNHGFSHFASQNMLTLRDGNLLGAQNGNKIAVASITHVMNYTVQLDCMFEWELMYTHLRVVDNPRQPWAVASRSFWYRLAVYSSETPMIRSST